MKKLILFLSALLLSGITYAQSGSQTFGVSAGAMFPLKDLADYNLADSSSGASSAGYHIQISYDYLFSDLFGLGIDVEFNSTKYSMSKITKYYKTRLDDVGRKITSSAGWTIGGIFARYYLRLPLGSKISWEIAPLAGFIGTYSPSYHIVSTSILNPLYHQNYYRQRSKAFSFAYGVETKLNIKKNQHGLFFEGRLVNSKVYFKQVTGTEINGKPYDEAIKMNLMYIVANVGYTYYF